MATKLFIVKNLDGTVKLFRNQPALMSQRRISKLSDKDHPRTNISFTCDPVWVDYSALENIMTPGCTISRTIVNSIGLNYNSLDYKKVYEIEVTNTREINTQVI